MTIEPATITIRCDEIGCTSTNTIVVSAEVHSDAQLRREARSRGWTVEPSDGKTYCILCSQKRGKP